MLVEKIKQTYQNKYYCKLLDFRKRLYSNMNDQNRQIYFLNKVKKEKIVFSLKSEM